MRLHHAFKTSIVGLKTNRVRSALTILGIVIGISAIIMLFSLGKGAEGLILNELGGMGAETIVIRPGQEPKGPSDFAETLFSDSLKTKDVEALKRKTNVPHLVNIAPSIVVPGSVSYKGETFKSFNFGWSADLMEEMFDAEIESGVLFGEREIRNKSSVAIIGSKVVEELFEYGESAIGKNIKIRGRNFKVVGVLAPRGQVSTINIDELVVIPYSTAQVYLMGIDHYHEIIAKADSPENVDRTVEDIKATLRETHGITDPSKDDFFIVTQKGMVNQISTILNVLTIFLSFVMSISLVVGGVGVMNIMLVSVTERTKEIGLRKAIGATNKDILTQFLFESVILTIAGGVIGVLLGASLSFIIALSLATFAGLAWPFSFSFGAATLGIAVSAFIGILFGIYPAQKASHKSPIDALRYE